MGQSLKAWIAATVLAGLVIGAAGWFLVITPTKATTADTRASTEMEQGRTITLKHDLDLLKSQFATLDDSRAELEDLTVQVPSKADTSSFRRMIMQHAIENGLAILSVSTDVPTVVGQPAAPASETETDTSTATADPETATPTPDPEAEVPVAPVAPVTNSLGQTLVGIPLEITVIGPYAQARAFVASLQVTEGRLFLVSGVGLVSQIENPAASGRPATALGDVELSVQGFLFVLVGGSSSEPEPSASPEPSPEPLPSTERNPFAPVASAAPAG